MRLSFLKSPTFFIAAPVIVSVCILEACLSKGWRIPALTETANEVELLSFDWRVRLAHTFNGNSRQEATNLALVEISDNTIRAVKDDKNLGFGYGLYWPRDVYAAALKELTQEGAKAVAFDVLFPESRQDQGAVAYEGSIAAPDDIFADQLKKSSNAIIAADSDVLPYSQFRTNAWRVGNITVESDADGKLRRAHAFIDYRVWSDIILKAAAQLQWDLSKTIDDRANRQITFFSENHETNAFPTDDEGRIITSKFFNAIPPDMPPQIAPYENARVWSVGIILAARELNLDLDHPEIKPGLIVLHGPNGLTRSIPVDDQNRFYIDWSLELNNPKVKELSFEVVLASGVQRKHKRETAQFAKDKLVVIGSTATGNDLRDTGATPLESRTFLVLKHLNVANSVISGRFVRQTPLAVDLALIVMVGLLSAWITWVVERAYQGTLLMFVFALVYVTVCVYLYVGFRSWVPIILPMFCAGGVTHLCGLAYRVRFEQSQKKMIRQMFSRLVSPDVVNELLKQGEIEVGGQRGEITVYFADVRGFTELTDAMQEQAEKHVKENNLTPAQAEAYYDAKAKEGLDIVSSYLVMIADIVKQHKGTFDKYIGDCVMAFWGAPLPNEHHALDAVRAAVEAQRAISEFNRKRQAENQLREEQNVERALRGLPLLPKLPMLSMGTGINTGTAIVGFMGSETHVVNYTAFGREVNLASRLEGVSGHGRIIIGEATYEALKRDDPELAGKCLEWAPRTVKGFRTPVRIYEVLWQPATGVLQQPGENTDIRITKTPPAHAPAAKSAPA